MVDAGSKLKDMFNRQTVSRLAAAVKSSHPPFDDAAFIAQVFDDAWESRELKQRMRHITLCLHDHLPEDYPAAVIILRDVIGRLDKLDFEKMVFPDYVEVYGLADLETSIPALERFTRQVSAEFAVRPFIEKYPETMMAQMLKWAEHEDANVRRLASEGCRPRLPWGMALSALKADPSPILPILEILKLDESESVRRSVANNLNDISKDNPDIVLGILKRWQGEDREEIRWITGHALRTLVKAGHPDALELLGYPVNPAITVRNVTVEPAAIQIGERVTFRFEIESRGESPQNLMIDYVVHHVRANGRRTPKVFKLSKKTIQPGEVLVIQKEHSFRPVTTRKYYPGTHALEPKINGRVYDRVEFVLDEPSA